MIFNITHNNYKLNFYYKILNNKLINKIYNKLKNIFKINIVNY